jgi:hypothetical protein
MTTPLHQLLLATVITVSTGAAHADQTTFGPWNAEAIRIAQASPLAQSAIAFIRGEIAKIQNPLLKRETEDAVLNPDT